MLLEDSNDEGPDGARKSPRTLYLFDRRGKLGVIAATTDILVRRNNTHLPCQADHIVLPGWHTGILFRKETIAQTRHFLAYGRFERREQPAKAA